MTALDDGVVDTTARVETAGGVWPMYGRHMKDHNWRRGGYGLLTLPQTLLYSSNIGISRIIDDNYKDQPEKFVRGIYRTGLADNLNIPLVGSSPAVIRLPKKNKRGQWLNWSKTALPWMSIGYETQIPPISMITFYNAIANNGKMMQPRFVKKVVKNGEVLIEFPPKILRSQICKPKTLGEIQDSTSILLPDVKNGNVLAANYVLSHLGINANQDWSGSYTKGNPIWGSAEIQNNTVVKLRKIKVHGHKFIPNVEGMGARDAVYILESRGVKVKLDGRGKVTSQSLEPGHSIKKGDVCHLTLQ